MIVSLSKRTQFSLLIQSTSIMSCPVHFVGRTFWCPGEESCPACPYSRAKWYHYALCTVEKKIECVEFCDSLIKTIREILSCVQPFRMSGAVVRGSRSTKRAMWKLDECQHRLELLRPVTDFALCDAVSLLYQLPRPKAEENAAQWVERVKKCHVPLLAKHFVPM